MRLLRRVSPAGCGGACGCGGGGGCAPGLAWEVILSRCSLPAARCSTCSLFLLLLPPCIALPALGCIVRIGIQVAPYLVTHTPGAVLSARSSATNARDPLVFLRRCSSHLFTGPRAHCKDPKSWMPAGLGSTENSHLDTANLAQLSRPRPVPNSARRLHKFSESTTPPERPLCHRRQPSALRRHTAPSSRPS